MAGFEIEITVREDVTAALGRLVAAGTDMTPAMKDIAGHLADETRERFETGVAPDGTPWKPSRRARKQGGKTLVDTGDLVASIREDWGSTYAAAGPEASGGAAVYALIHQMGGTIQHPGGTAYTLDEKRWAKFVSNNDASTDMARTGAHAIMIVARPYLGFTSTDADYSVAVLTEHLERALSGSGAAA